MAQSRAAKTSVRKRLLAAKILGRTARVLTRSRLRMIKARLPATGESIKNLSVVRLQSKSRRLRKRPKMQRRKRGATERLLRKSQKKRRKSLQSRPRRREGEMAQSRNRRRTTFADLKPAWRKRRSLARRRKSEPGTQLQRPPKRRLARKRFPGRKRRSPSASQLMRRSRSEELRIDMD